jgi:bacillithiol biosynthesis cysteine-adding enzyme BshC
MKLTLPHIPGISDLFRDYLNNADRVAPFFPAHFQNLSSFHELAERLTKVNRPHWRILISILEEQNRAFGCGRKTLINISKLTRPSFVAVTGQQTGLFSGPLYTIYKALTTVKLARLLSDELKIEVIPLFYLVSEDHDFAEVSWIGLIDARRRFRTIRYSPGGLMNRTPVFEVRLDSSILSLIEEFDENTPSTEFKSDILQKLRSCYQPGDSFHAAFARWLHILFSAHGIVLLDASDNRLKSFVRPVFERELSERLSGTCIERTNSALIKKGYHIQLTIFPDRPNIFILENGRHSLEYVPAGLRHMEKGTIYSAEELLENPHKLSPKAALRPMVQDTLLPTIAYVAGPGEIAYWAQLKGIYEALHLPMPILVPRAGFTLLEPGIKRLLARYSISAVDILTDHEQTINKAYHSLLPGGLEQELTEFTAKMLIEFEKMGAGFESIDPTLRSVHEKTRQNLTHQLDVFQKKVTKAISQKNQIASGQLTAVSHNLLPDGALQERKLNISPYLIKYNWKVLDRIFQEIDPLHCTHNLLEL